MTLRTPGQDLLLRAALLDGPAGLDAWERWRRTTQLDDAPPGSYRLLPLIHRNLETLAVEYSDSGRLTGIRRKTFVQNQLLFRATADVLRALRNADIKTMLLRGAALVADYYLDAGVRPMRNADVLVPESKTMEAVRVLRCAGWGEVNQPLSALTTGYRRAHSSIAFRTGDFEIRLHWHVLPRCPSDRTDEWFWNACSPIEFHGVGTRTLNSTDQLLYACLASLKWSYEPCFWRVADALTVWNACGRIDFDRFRSLAADQHLTFLLYQALQRLEGFAAPIREELVLSLAAFPVIRMDRREFEFMTVPYRNRRLAALLAGCYRQHARGGQDSLSAHLWRTLRWVVAPHFAARIAAIAVGIRLPKHPRRAQPSPADAEGQAHPRRRAARRPTVLPG